MFIAITYYILFLISMGTNKKDKLIHIMFLFPISPNKCFGKTLSMIHTIAHQTFGSTLATSIFKTLHGFQKCY